MWLKRVMCAALLLLVSCGEPVPSTGDARILLLGDSMFATNQNTERAVANVIEAELGEEVIDRSVIGARYFYKLPLTGAAGLNLPMQYRKGAWDWVVINGGGNDLLFGCGCGFCDGVLNRLVSKDGRAGAIPSLVAMIRKTGAKVVYSGYMRNPGTTTPIKGCGPAGNELDRRLTLMAQFDKGVTFVPMANLVPYGDRSYHQIDGIHPTAKASLGIGKRLAAVIAADKGRAALRKPDQKAPATRKADARTSMQKPPAPQKSVPKP